MSDASVPRAEPVSEAVARRVDQLCDRFEAAWKAAGNAAQRPRIEDYLHDAPETERYLLLRELLALELDYRGRSGETLTLGEYRQRFPAQGELVANLFREAAGCVGLHGGKADSSRPSVTSGPEPVQAEAADQPLCLGRYQITGILGKGGFGVVYQGYDAELQRMVAVKVPYRSRVAQPEDVKAYLAEARIVAGLDHPHIVPVYDVGHTDDGLCFVVSKFIEGSDLAKKTKQTPLSIIESAELVTAVAEALHYAHARGLVHRDIKPGNILLDTNGQPYVADFGLALRDEDFGKGLTFAGTPAYMSPEQARREGHRVDGRSDLFSLGVVFYELLTGQRPFRGATQQELLEQIITVEPRLLRQVDDSIAKDLERICVKALAKRASERYATGRDMVEDLQYFLDHASGDEKSAARAGVAETAPSTPIPATTPTPTPAVKIVPKGLRSFDANDADFFLELLPGARDRDGLPESIRFWKTRIEETDLESTFSVGLIYGPSGCGKSSLVKAGLLPRLSHDVIAVYVEAMADETEARLLNGLRKRCPALPSNLGLKETLAALRRGHTIPAGKKVLIVLDQFEQWLHARMDPNSNLVQASRQCDGGRVQCVVMVRDDFWMAVTRFLQALEIRLVEGQNSAAVDLFDPDHARKVLAAFGRAFGKLPQNAGETSAEQKQFLEQAVSGLAQEGKVICVRLALFAEMMKGKAWTPATLKQVGGTVGVGVTFLEETFSAATAPPGHRYHQNAARAVLQALLPGSGTDIKGHMRSHAELLASSGYGSRPKDFDDLIRILDSEMRLITPTDPEGADSENRPSPPVAGQKYYQLTHDYLVPALRAWLTRKQKETRRGRAELRLAERATAWNAKSENRDLPAWWEWANIRLFTRRRDWNRLQRQMMAKATRYHVVRGLTLVLFLAALAWGSWEGYGRFQAHALQDLLVNANTSDLPTIIPKMASYRRWLDPLLRDLHTQAERTTDARKLLPISLALLPVDASQVDYLCERLLDANPQEVPVLRDALQPYQGDLTERLWAVVEQPGKGKESQRLRAASALALYEPESRRWDPVGEPVAADLVAVPAVYLATWLEALRPVRSKLLTPLKAIFRDRRRGETERSVATDLLGDYAANEPEDLADLLMDADAKQFANLYPKLQPHGARGLAVLEAEVNTQPPPEAKNDAKEKLAKRQANAAVALLRLNVPDKVWPLLQHRPDPRVRSYLIHRFRPLGADVRALVKRLDEEPDVTIRRALILSLGEYGEQAWPAGERAVLLTKMQELYRTADDPGLHAAAEWLLRQPPWQQEEWLRQTNEAWAKDRVTQEKRLQEIKQVLAKEKGKAAPRWYVSGQGQTMVVISGPVEFLMGSPPTEEGRFANESPHRKRIDRTFALAATPVTLEQYRKFAAGYGAGEIEQWARTADSPVIGTSWFQAVAYCNWLSQQEGLPESQWCYEPLQDPKAMAALVGSSVGLLAGWFGPLPAACALDPRRTKPEYKGGMKLAQNYLQRTGYRLPTEAELEYATRAAALTSRYFGETEEMLPRYAWYAKNSQDRTWPVGSLKPNDLGLFDMHGNVWTVCQEEFRNYPQGQGTPHEDKECSLTINTQEGRALRGGSFLDPAGYVRSAHRYRHVPANRDDRVGFRTARTLTAECAP